jgi:hypothetical protein
MCRSKLHVETRSPREHCRNHPAVLVEQRHHLLVRWSHWLNVPILLGLILSGISICWASPIYQHKPDPLTGNFDVAADIGIWICAHVPGLSHYSSPPDWIYNHMSLGPGMLAFALRLHWLSAYAFMLNGAVYIAGLIAGGAWRGLLPRRSDLLDAFRMFRYYIGLPLAGLARRQWPHPAFRHKVQRSPARGILRCSGHGMPFGRYGMGGPQANAIPFAGSDLWGVRCGTRLAFLAHVGLHPFRRTPCILVLADGWDTFRGMIAGWSAK